MPLRRQHLDFGHRPTRPATGMGYVYDQLGRKEGGEMLVKEFSGEAYSKPLVS